MAENNNIGAIILAAGSSTRLGSLKQLLKFEGKTLLERITETALAAGLDPIIVLGASAEKIRSSVKNLPAKIVLNENWESGMSTSIIEGLKKALEENPKLSAVILLLCDQPFITTESILRLIKAYKDTEKPIVASEYKETVGVPAVFSKEVFPELFELKGTKGAKTIIKNRVKTDIHLVSMPEAAVDIDTVEDVKQLNLPTGA